jgi:hypothetical protein
MNSRLESGFGRFFIGRITASAVIQLSRRQALRIILGVSPTPFPDGFRK